MKSASFTKANFNTDLPYTITSKDTPFGRFYTCDGGCVYPSVTTILGDLSKKHIDAWRDSIGHEKADGIKNQAAHKGSLVHGILEKYIDGEHIDYSTEMPNVVEIFEDIVPILNDHVGLVYGVELPLYSHTLKTAGRSDLIAMWDEKLSIIDFKTARKIKTRADIVHYFMQASCYAMMWNELYCKDDNDIYRIDDIVIIMAVAHEKPIVFYGKVESYRPWVERLFVKERKQIEIPS